MISGDIRAAQGAEGEFYEMLRKFHPFWERIDVVCPRTENSAPRTLFGRVHLHPVGRFAYPDLRAKLTQPRYTFIQAKQLIREGLREGRPYGLMTVHEVPPFHNSWAALRLARRYGLPVVSELHHVEGHPLAADLPSLLRRSATGLWVRYLWRRVAAIRTVNAKEVPEYLLARGVPRERIKVIYSFDIDLDQFSPAECGAGPGFPVRGPAGAQQGAGDLSPGPGPGPQGPPGVEGRDHRPGAPGRDGCGNLALELDLEENLEFISWVKDRKELDRILSPGQGPLRLLLFRGRAQRDPGGHGLPNPLPGAAPRHPSGGPGSRPQRPDHRPSARNPGPGHGPHPG